jgi:ubiquitin-protein ligase E3 C
MSSLTFFAPRIPLLSLASSSVPRILDEINSNAANNNSTTDEKKVHLLANLSLLVPPRYASLPPQAMEAYLRLTADTMKCLPVYALDPAERATNASGPLDGDEDDADELEGGRISVEVVSSFATPSLLPRLDSKTLTRVATLPSPGHIAALLNAAYRSAGAGNLAIQSALFTWLTALGALWPARRDRVMTAVLAWSGGAGVVRELYRGRVRGGPLGKESSVGSLTGE